MRRFSFWNGKRNGKAIRTVRQDWKSHESITLAFDEWLDAVFICLLKIIYPASRRHREVAGVK
jgi:hypothetical protein